MKIRSDFVTNSSSSSFIAVFAKIVDREKADETIKDNNLEDYIKTGQEILDEMAGRYFFGYGGEWAGVDLTPDKDSVDPEAEYLVWGEYDGVDEDNLVVFDDNGDFDYYDYDVCIDDFPREEVTVYESITEENGFADIDKGFGAGRDG